MTTELRERVAGTSGDDVADALAGLLADTYTLYLKTHGYHWNVTGPHFSALHAMFEEQYLELRDAVDLLAERIRQLGPFAPGSYAELGELSAIADEAGVPEAMAMVRALAEGHEAASRRAREVVTVAEGTGDVATADIATERIEAHDKAAWMLRATAA